MLRMVGVGIYKLLKVLEEKVAADRLRGVGSVLDPPMTLVQSCQCLRLGPFEVTASGSFCRKLALADSVTADAGP
jgi:hypothetical protein